MKRRFQIIEIVIHFLFWVFFFTAVNVDWSSNWLDKSLRSNTPSPLIILIFPTWFYINAFWLTPKFMSKKSWLKFIFFGSLIFIVPEIIRSTVLSLLEPTTSFSSELNSRDSFIFGSPSPFLFSLYLSFGYRFTKDWFINRKKIQELKTNKNESVSSMNTIKVVSDEEADIILHTLSQVMSVEKPYLNQDISLGDLAKLTNTTDKKLSYLINQRLDSKFYNYINKFRIEAFKNQINDRKHRDYSLVGIARDCGFNSKSSFYRAFKKEMNISPSEYLDQISA